MELPAETLRAAAAGDAAAIDALIVAWGPTVVRWCGRLGGPRIDAEDAAQDALERILRKLPGLDRAETFPAWLFQTCRGVVAQHRRRAWLRRWVGAPSPKVPDGRPGPGESLVAQVHAALDELDPERREVLVLCDLEERPAPEVARLVGVPEGTVRSRLRTARQQFAEAARRRGLDPTTESGASMALGEVGG